jgi:hypothetical protein
MKPNTKSSSRVHRSAHAPIRTGLSWTQLWEDEDRGMILSWERGREMRVQKPELADRAEAGELVNLPWRGGTEGITDIKAGKKEATRYGSLYYLAMWQGLRNEDLGRSTARRHRYYLRRT